MNKDKKYNVIGMIYKISPFYSVLFIVLTIIKAVMATLVTTITTANFIDMADDILHAKRDYQCIWLPLILLLLVLLFVNTIGTIMELIKRKLTLQIEEQFKPQLIKTQAAMDYRYIEDNKTWEIIRRISTNPQNVLINGFSADMNVLTTIVYIISVLSIILFHVWWATILIVLFSIPMIAFSIKSGRKSYQIGKDTEKLNRRTDYLENILTERSNMQERSLFGYGQNLSNQWFNIKDQGRRIRVKVQLKYMLLTKGATIALSLVAILVAITLIPSVISGYISAGMYMGIVGTVLSVTHQIGWDMSWSVETLANTREYLRDFEQYQSWGTNEEVLECPCKDSIKFETLEFLNVRFKYPGSDKYILDGLSFRLQKGKHYAFVGSNGVGKTTITKLLTGLYTNYEGNIYVNGVELRQYNHPDLKALFTTVYQDFAKYYISIKENVALGDISMDYSDEEILNVFNKVGIDELISTLNNGLDTPLGKIHESGQEVSGGQWQRIAIARALISRSPVKILDEPTSALDPISESQIYFEFEKLMDGKTTIFISHRLSSTKLADEIMVLGDGRIVEQGTHQELMKQKGQYFTMFEAQRRWYQ